MSVNRPAAGGGREILVAPQRILKWIDGFDGRHRITDADFTTQGITVSAADGSVAACSFPTAVTQSEVLPAGDARTVIEHFGQRCQYPHRIAVIFARRGAFAVGVFDGSQLLASKVDTSYVQGRTAAGGWSQQRYARRRGKQAAQAISKAVEATHRVFATYQSSIEAVVGAGDKDTVAEIVKEPRLRWTASILVSAHIGDVPEPRLASLRALPEKFRAVRIHLHQPVG